MGSLYLDGAVTRHAKLKDRCDWKSFDELEVVLSEIAKKHGVFIERAGINDSQDIAFVIRNQEANSVGIYSGEFTEGEFQVEADDAFAAKAEAFIAEINQAQDIPDKFKNLEWGHVAIRHYVSS